MVEGQRLMQAASDIFLGWISGTDPDGVTRDFYVRQLWDGKGSAEIEQMNPETMGLYGKLCGWTLARAHARSGDRVAIAAYLGKGDSFDRAMGDFAEAYADQNEQRLQGVRERRQEGPPQGRHRSLRSASRRSRKLPLGIGVDELERPLVGVPGLVGSIEAPQQLRAGRVEVVVVLELQAVHQRERGLRVAGLGDGRRPVQLHHG